MHEMALCAGILGLIEEAAEREPFCRVRKVVLELGELGHAAPEALLFCFDAVTRGTVAEGARLVIARVPGAGWCPDCARTVPLAERFAACPACGGHQVQLTDGDAMRVRELEVE